YSQGWDVCSQLGQCESYTRLSARQELMAFALTHCPPANIQNLLAASSSMQTQLLFKFELKFRSESFSSRTLKHDSWKRNNTESFIPNDTSQRNIK
ncbi:NBAS subunit of NRZ tethering complex isoform X1, partial [Tachysurus ichikawai]